MGAQVSRRRGTWRKRFIQQSSGTATLVSAAEVLTSSGIRINTQIPAMLTETFPGGNGAAWPGSWTPGYDAAGASSQQNGWGRLTATDSTKRGVRTAAAVPPDLESTGLFRFVSYGWPQISHRAGDNLNGDRGYYWQPWHNGAEVTLGREGSQGLLYSGGATLLSGINAGVTFSTGTVVAWRFSTVTEPTGVRIRLKLWLAGQQEPGPWLVDYLDTSPNRVLTSGQRFGFSNAAPSGGSIEVDNVVLTAVT